ncbi:MAG: hypothetical protein DI604_17890 [Delftia acidovorans]|nr:MAG: hypothetical protein DI604_17890 [Delftia acidovorans]
MERDWIEHSGSGRPVPAGTLVDLKFNDGDVINETPAGFWDGGLDAWLRDARPVKITHYRVVSEITA